MIPSMDKILISTDFSEVANRAVPHGYAAVSPGGEVHLIHVIEHQDVPSHLYAHYSADQLHNPENRKEVAEKMDAELKALIPSDAIQTPHIAEAIQYRKLDRGAG